MYTVYILRGEKTSKYYIGRTEDIFRRLNYHNSGYSKSTKSGIPWKLVYTKNFSSRSEAMKRESYLKKMKNRDFIKTLITQI